MAALRGKAYWAKVHEPVQNRFDPEKIEYSINIGHLTDEQQTSRQSGPVRRRWTTTIVRWRTLIHDRIATSTSSAVSTTTTAGRG